MADLLARFRLVDEMSDRLGRMAESGQDMAERLENIGDAADAAFGNIVERITSATSTIDGTASSLNNLQGAADAAASSTDSLSDTINHYEDATREAANQNGEYADTAAAQEEAMRRCEQAAGELSSSIEKACETQGKLSEAVEKAAQTSEELAENDRVSAETKEELTRASQEAEAAMAELTAAQQEAEAAMAEYEAALASGTENMAELEQAAERVSQASNTLDEANRRAADATEELASSTERAAEEAEDSSERSQDAAENLANVLATAGIAALVLKMADAFMAASEAAAEFEVAIMKISTIADTTQVSLSQISEDLMNLSMDTGISVAGLSDAAYSALSASVNTANAVEFTATASKLAAGGFTSSATAVDVLTTALNAYGLEADRAENISDMLITTQNLGKTTVDELAASVGKVIPLASAYGVEMDNLSAAYAELTKGGIATAEAGTYLKSMLNELGDSGSAVSAVLSEETGYSFAQLMEQGYSLGDVMEVLGASVNGNAGAFNELWSSSEAGIGALSLYNAGAEQFNTTLDAMQNSIGATETAYSTMTDTTAHAQEELSNAADNLKISIGKSINPLIEKLYGLGTNILNGMARFAQENPVIIKAISAIAVGLGTVAVALVGVSAASVALKAAIPAIVSFGTAVNAALGPIGWIAIGITAVVAAGMALTTMFEEAEDETAGMTAATREQYYELQDLKAEYEETCEKYGETSEEASRLKYQVDDLSEAFEANKQTVEEFTAEVDALCESVSQISEDFYDSMEAINSTETGSFALIQKYEDLATQAELTGAQQKELEAVTKKLSESYPELAAQIENATLSTEDYVEAMKQACEQEAEEQRQQQAQDTYIEALVKRAELTEEIAKAQENLNLEQEKMDDMDGWDHFWTVGEWDDLEAYQTALDDLNEAMEENDAVISKIEKGWEDLAEAEEAAANETVSWEKAVDAAFENVEERIIGLCEAYGEVYNAAFESLEGQFGLFDKASMKSEEYTNATVKNAQKALDSQLAYWEDYNANLQTLVEYGEGLTEEARENYTNLLAYAQSGSEEAAGLANSIAAAIRNGDAEAVEALSNTVAQVSAQQDIAAATTADFVTGFSSQMDEIEQEMQSTVEGMNLDTEAAAAATETINAYINSIRAGKAGAVAAAEDVANSVSMVFNSTKASMNVSVNSSSSIPGHANGTTNAEDIFIAGEEGPELIVGQQGSTVFPAEETNKIIHALNTMELGEEDIYNTFENTHSVINNYQTAGSNNTKIFEDFSGKFLDSLINPFSFAWENLFHTEGKETSKAANNIEAYANGTTWAQDAFIAGEEGPELIVGQHENMAFPTEETDRLISALNDKQQPLQILAAADSKIKEEQIPEQVKRIQLEIAGSGIIEAVGSKETDRETILEILYEHIKPVLMNIVQSEIYEEGDSSYEY